MLAFTPNTKQLWINNSTIGMSSLTSYDVLPTTTDVTAGTDNDDNTAPTMTTTCTNDENNDSCINNNNNRDDEHHHHPYISRKKKTILNQATLGTILGSTDGLPLLMGGEGN